MLQPWYHQDHHEVLSSISIFIVHDLRLSFPWRRFLHLKITQSQRIHLFSGVLQCLEVLHVGRKAQLFRFRWHRTRILLLAFKFAL